MGTNSLFPRKTNKSTVLMPDDVRSIHKVLNENGYCKHIKGQGRRGGIARYNVGTASAQQQDCSISPGLQGDNDVVSLNSSAQCKCLIT